jgi:hypothetical protein
MDSSETQQECLQALLDGREQLLHFQVSTAAMHYAHTYTCVSFLHSAHVQLFMPQRGWPGSCSWPARQFEFANLDAHVSICSIKLASAALAAEPFVV